MYGEKIITFVEDVIRVVNGEEEIAELATQHHRLQVKLASALRMQERLSNIGCILHDHGCREVGIYPRHMNQHCKHTHTHTRKARLMWLV